MNIICKQIEMDNPLYQEERELRNRILLRPIGVPDFGWEMFDSRSAHFVATQNNKVVGCALLNLYESGPDSGRLMQMAVSEKLQGKGIGKQLVLKLLEGARALKLAEVTCHARDAVVNFYSSLGFEEYGEPFEEVGIAHRHMRIDLLET